MTVLVNKRIRKSNFPVRFIRQIAQTAMAEAGISDDVMLSVSIVGVRTMSELNSMWRKEEGPTDVLSFPMEEGEDVISPERILGDVVICEPVLLEQARRYNTTAERELIRLLVHGILHLVGYDHYTDEEKAEMDAEAKRIERKLILLLDSKK